ncbi:MAG TPA: aldo/keto reductase [Rhizomicrobium sp.]|nr:aldo/keto reductase [Rhizomicrobium sp.]
MPLNHYVTLGRSGLRVSPYCLGAMTFGEEWGFGSDEKTSTAIIDRFLEAGGNFIDTANVYNRGHSEEILGNHIGRDAAKRDRVVIATKFSANMHSGDPNGGGANRKSIIAACEASLRRLKTDYIDLYWQHWEDPFTPVEETMRALDDLVTAGKVRYLGFSDTPAWKVAQAQVTAHFRNWAPLIALQIEYSLLERTVEGDLIPMAREMGLGVTPWSPLRSGVLSGKYSRTNMKAESAGRSAWVERNFNEHAFAVLDVLMDVAKKRGTTPARVALAWVGAKPGVSSIIIGARTLEQLDDNLAALDLQLERDDLSALDDISKPTLNFPAGFLPNAVSASYGGMTVNGRTFGTNPTAEMRRREAR